MTNPTKVAVIGVGRFGRHHARVYHELSDAELVGVYGQGCRGEARWPAAWSGSEDSATLRSGGAGEIMTNEEFEKRVEFILDQQARFASDIQQLQEAQARTEQTVAQTEQIVARLANVTSVGFKDVTAKIDALVDSQIRLTDAQSRTDDTLRSLIAVVDRYFREGRNGQTGQ